MRDPNRIPLVLKQLEEIWTKHADIRLAQLIENLHTTVGENLYYIEDQQLIELLRNMYDATTTP